MKNIKKQIDFRILHILLLLSVIIFACSPQKRLSKLIEEYPELLKDSTVYSFIHKDSLITEYSYSDSFFVDSLLENIKITNTEIVVGNKKSRASLSHENGYFRLRSESLPDTTYVVIRDSIKIPEFVVKKEIIKEIPIHIKIFASVGLFFFLLLLVAMIAYFITKR